MTTIQDAPARTFDVRSPASGTVAGTYPVHSARDVAAAVSRAHEAAEWWSALDYAERTACLDRWRARIARGRDDLARVIQVEMPTIMVDGVGASGFGRVHGPDGLKEFTYAKATTRQRFPSPLPLTTFGRGAGVDNIVDWLVGLLHGRAG